MGRIGIMDRVDYIHSIDTGELEYDSMLVNYFDQLMGLYGLMQPCNYSIKVINSSNELLLLELEFTDEISSSKIMNVLDSLNHVFCVYERRFIFDTRVISIDEMQRPVKIQIQISS